MRHRSYLLKKVSIECKYAPVSTFDDIIDVTDYNVELHAIEDTVTVVPALIFSANRSDSIVLAPYGTVVDAIKRIESNQHPDDVTVVTLEGNDTVYKFEFPPGNNAKNALRLLKWFRDMVEFAGPIDFDAESEPHKDHLQ